MSVSHANRDQLHPPEGDNPGSVVRIGPARRSEAIERLVSTGGGDDRAAAERFLHYARTNAVQLDGLWSWLDETGRLTFSVLAVPSPGRTAMIFASHPRTPRDVSVVGRVIDHACGQVAGRDVHLTQALLEPGEKLERSAFVEAGFQELATLSYLERPLSRTNPATAPVWPAGARVEKYRDELYDVLARILEQSYEQTLDCPGLYGLRDTRDIIAGHRATGKFDPALWTLLYVDEQPAGALLLSPFPAHRTVELVYLGLAPFARGRGLGRQLLRHGLSLLKGRRERTLTLAVDQRNTPALTLYEGHELRPIVRRVALIRSLR
jgi:ribosomal protein S18 acetylase RimI-like enzyme